MKDSQDIFWRQRKPRPLKEVLRMVVHNTRKTALNPGNNLEVTHYRDHLRYVNHICNEMGIKPGLEEHKSGWIVKLKRNCQKLHSFFINLVSH